MAKQDAILKEKEQEREEKVIETVSKTDQFFRENKKTIYGILIALVVDRPRPCRVSEILRAA